MKGIEQYFQYDASLTPIYYNGTWNASTNTPTLASSVGTAGDFYLVSVAGSTDLNGITNWAVGDWAIFNGTAWQRVEGGADGNFANLSVTGTSTLGNIQVASNTISSVDTNGNIVLAPNGTGDVQLDADTVRVGDANANATITTNGTGDLILNTNSGTNSGTIRIYNGSNSNIEVEPNGTGNIHLYGDTIVVGDLNTDVNVTSAGTGDLRLFTNGGTNSGEIRIYDGVNGNITLEPNGTGNVGIGTSSPGAKLTVYDTSNAQVLAQGTTSYAQFHANNTSGDFHFGIDNSTGAGFGAGAYGRFLYSTDAYPMAFFTNSVERMRLDASGNLGLGVTPSAWRASGDKAMQIGSWMSLFTDSGLTAELASNMFVSGASQFIYSNTGAATRYRQYLGQHEWYTAPSGTAGNAISFTQAMTLDASGRLLVGLTTAPSASVNQAVYSGVQVHNSAGGGFANISIAGGGCSFYTYTGSMGAETYTERARIDSSGNLGLGVTPSAWGSAYKAMQIGSLSGMSLMGYSGAAEFGNNFYFDTAYRYAASTSASRYTQSGGAHAWYTAPSGTAGNTISFTQAMTLTGGSTSELKLTNDSSGTGALDGLSVLLSGADAYLYNRENGPLLFGTNNTERARITNGGDLLLGTTSGNGLKLDFSPTSSQQNGITYVSSSPNSYTDIYGCGTSGSWQGAIRFFTSNNAAASERMRLDSSGNVLIGKTSLDDTVVGFSVTGSTSQQGAITSTLQSSTSGNTTLQVYSTGASAYRFYVDMAGTVFATSTTISAISDQRFKENIVDLDAGLNAVMALKPRKFDWKVGKGKDIKGDRGFIAQELEQVFPDLIDEWKDAAPEGEEPYKSVRQDLIPVLVKAIQELNAKVEALEAQLGA